MTDIRKMLELAAKACGYEIDRENQHFREARRDDPPVARPA